MGAVGHMGAVGQKIILITGATGFIGQHLVAIARVRGYRVRVVVRNSNKIPAAWRDDSDLEIILADLAATSSRVALAKAVGDADAVIHTAGSMHGTDADHEVATHLPLRNILTASREANARCLSFVLASSFSVYGIGQQMPGAVVTEDTPTEASPKLRDAYCRAKIVAEKFATSACVDLGVSLTIVRPGAVFGRGMLWNSHLGVLIGRVGVLLAKDGEVPLCHVSHCAEALMRAAETSMTRNAAEQECLPRRVYNVVDSELPSRLDYALKLREAGQLTRVVNLSWAPLSVAVKVLRKFGGGMRLPGLLRRETFAYRLQPMRYSNAKIREELCWEQRLGLNELIDQAVEPLNTEAGS